LTGAAVWNKQFGTPVTQANLDLPAFTITVVPTQSATVASSWLLMPKSGQSELMPPLGSITP
jgi:hypothetical protein